MASDLPFAWLRQAESDLDAIGRCYDPNDPRTTCQAIAKCQQVVEKSVKAIVAAYGDTGLASQLTGYSHDVGKLISALLRRAAAKGPQRNLAGLLNEHRRSEIHALTEFAPKRTVAGALARRNSEYPFQNPDGSWRAPADPGSFRDADVKRFRQLSKQLIRGATQVVSAVYR